MVLRLRPTDTNYCGRDEVGSIRAALSWEDGGVRQRRGGTGGSMGHQEEGDVELEVRRDGRG